MLKNREGHHSDDAVKKGGMNCDVKKLRCASLRSALQRCGALRWWLSYGLRLARCFQVPVLATDPPGHTQRLHSKVADLCQRWWWLSKDDHKMAISVHCVGWSSYLASWPRFRLSMPRATTFRQWALLTSIQCGPFQQHPSGRTMRTSALAWMRFIFDPTHHIRRMPSSLKVPLWSSKQLLFFKALESLPVESFYPLQTTNFPTTLNYAYTYDTPAQYSDQLRENGAPSLLAHECVLAVIAQISNKNQKKPYCANAVSASAVARPSLGWWSVSLQYMLQKFVAHPAREDGPIQLPRPHAPRVEQCALRCRWLCRKSKAEARVSNPQVWSQGSQAVQESKSWTRMRSPCLQLRTRQVHDRDSWTPWDSWMAGESWSLQRTVQIQWQELDMGVWWTGQEQQLASRKLKALAECAREIGRTLNQSSRTSTSLARHWWCECWFPLSRGRRQSLFSLSISKDVKAGSPAVYPIDHLSRSRAWQEVQGSKSVLCLLRHE